MRGLIVVAALSIHPLSCEQGHRFATLNLENYPKHAEQGPAALDMIEDLDVSAVALQEITKPDQFRAQARAHLGQHWDFRWADRGGSQRLGFLYDSRELRVIGEIIHDDTLLHRNAKPAYEIVALPRGQRTPIHFFVVHLKATNKSEAIRARQLEALAPILAARRAQGARVVFLGDFNSTNLGDRHRLQALAADTDLQWASESLPCTNYWARRDGCLGHALDHVMTWQEPRSVAVGGACATEGCEPGETCPIYHSLISDHCPVVVEMAH